MLLHNLHVFRFILDQKLGSSALKVYNVTYNVTYIWQSQKHIGFSIGSVVEQCDARFKAPTSSKDACGHAELAFKGYLKLYLQIFVED